MKTASELLEQYFESFYTLQIASVIGDQPWICTVYFVSDQQHNLYWLSLPTRRHSLEIEQHPNVACAIVIQNIIGKPVIGIQIEGKAEMLVPPLVSRDIVENYAAKFNREKQWVSDFVADHTEHRLYKLTPSAIYLFDEENFPGGQRQKVF